MAEEGPKNKAEIQEIFRRLRSISANRACFDCNAKNPTWASVTYGVFICIDCSAVHRSLGVHLTFVRSTQLDTSWTWTQLRNMQLGGNANAETFFTQHHCATSDAQQKYNSRAAHLYREKLNQTVAKYNKLHGNKIVFESDESVDTAQEKDADFFSEIQSAKMSVETLSIDNSARLFASKSPRNGSEKSEEGPNVDSVLTGESVAASRKSTIGQRKTGGKMMGAKKSGFGAQKVKADFSEIEKEAEKFDQMKERQIEEERISSEQRAINEEKQIASMSLAYKDISKMQQKRADQLKSSDPKKAEQMERLGMGFGMRSGVSHSAISDMKTIDQETPAYASKSSSASNQRKFEPFFEEYDAEEAGFVGSSDSVRYKLTTSMAIRPPTDWEVIECSPVTRPKEEDFRPKTREPVSTNTGSYTDDARQKFGNAKAISSDQFFSGSKDNDYERQANLSRFEGQSSISSADYFGDGRQKPLPQSSSFQTLQNVDLDDVKESVRQGVTKVAGKLSNLANGVMSSLQEKYGY